MCDRIYISWQKNHIADHDGDMNVIFSAKLNIFTDQ